MGEPVRLQLSRKAGFDLKAHSLATNGLPVVKVSRPGMWGNPFLIHPNRRAGRKWGVKYQSVPTAEDAVECFRLMMTCEPLNAEPDTICFHLRSSIGDLRGHNLACWCRLGDPCHADVLLEMANPAPRPEQNRAETGDTGGGR